MGKKKPSGAKVPSAAARGSGTYGPQRELIVLLRRHAQKFLKLCNVSSVGVGERIEGGHNTGELCIQFSVERKLSSKGIKARGSIRLPRHIEPPNGAPVRVDVVERRFRPCHQVLTVEEARAARGPNWEARRQMTDPLTPGVSVAHIDADGPGTVGAIVWGTDGSGPFILSNWHILHTIWGRVGDSIHQPAPADAAGQTIPPIGRLVRSHVGLAGDCAIASVERGAISETILDLGVAPTRVALAEVGDRLVKSSRTTGVTRALVTRVGVVTKMDYGDGEVFIGGFEVGPDPMNLPDDGEISRPGDSGALWMVDSAGAATGTNDADVAVGLHFGGETDPRRDAPEFALASNMHSVLEVLGVRLTRSAGGGGPV